MDDILKLLFVAVLLWNVEGREQSSAENTAQMKQRNISPIRIGIIGGGIGGCAASWFLREALDEQAEIVLFEKDKIGGRVATVNIAGREYEAGASVFHEKNMILQEFLKEFGLESLTEDDSDITVISKGSEVLFKTTGWTIADIAKSVWRYGLSPLKLGPWVDDYLTRFGKIYPLQARNCSYLRPTDLILAADEKFGEMLQTPLRDRMLSEGFAENFVDEIAAAAMRVNYNQRTSVPAFVGSVSLAGMKGPLHSVKGGNYQVAVRACQSASDVVLSSITTIESLPDGRFRLHTSTGGLEDFDYVILAAPLRKDGAGSRGNIVAFDGFPSFFKPTEWIGAYQRTVATFVEGELNRTFFGSSTSLDAVFNIEDNGSWSSIGRQHDVLGDSSTSSGFPVWKIFSTDPLPGELISEMFLRTITTSTTQVDWRAYPNYGEPPLHPPPFSLYGNNLIYLNAVEWAGSAMEMSLIAAKNAALAIVNDVMGVDPESCGVTAPSVVKDGQEL
ncbi:Prenylcysteine oxidase [Hypsibius exemplaris]|uniref:Prenylcysteine oxidase n=1 Tax=Hypsibius exemplaris TaxID=2072580 RepID=A0A1W0WK54_HYPEX|nr:Prenylcysteine oxidase [Hypsibius exemplaris]